MIWDQQSYNLLIDIKINKTKENKSARVATWKTFSRTPNYNLAIAENEDNRKTVQQKKFPVMLSDSSFE
jgi:hypothetical protein